MSLHPLRQMAVTCRRSGVAAGARSRVRCPLLDQPRPDAGWPPAPTRQPYARSRPHHGCELGRVPDAPTRRLDAGCARRAATRTPPLPVPGQARPSPRQRIDVEQRTPDCRGCESPGRNAHSGCERRCHRHCHVHILTLPQDLVVKDESILVFDNGDRTPSSTGVPALPLETQRVCSSKMEKTFSS